MQQTSHATDINVEQCDRYATMTDDVSSQYHHTVHDMTHF